MKQPLKRASLLGAQGLLTNAGLAKGNGLPPLSNGFAFVVTPDNKYVVSGPSFVVTQNTP